MKLSLSTACLYIYPLRWIFAIAQRAGFDGVELVISPEVELRGGAYARGLAEEYALPIFSVHPPLFQYPGWRDSFHSIAPFLPRALKVTQDVGARYLVIHLPRSRDARVGIGREFVQTLVGARTRSNGTGPRLSLENRAYFTVRSTGLILSTPQDLRAFADAHDFAMTLDTAHVGTWGIDLLAAYASFRGRLVNVHLSDLCDVSPRVERSPLLHSYVKQHQLPGAGKLPLREFLRALARDDYAGPITFELSPTALQIWNPRAAERILKEAVAFVRQAVT
ncbi:MAG: sugar phosphate isomerase/epimerase [Chloroflexota bacterium]|nr:sugar phosphate isomerase/epimerase [Chloroflexota bacterium]